MLKILFALTLGLSVATAQTAPPSTPDGEPKRGSISGVVKDDSGSPIAGATVGASINFRQAGRTTTDAQGRYELADLRPARYRLFMFRRQGHGSGRKIVTLAPGQALDNVDFLVVRPAEITGRVLDQNDEPVAGVQVYLVGSEYHQGALRHRFRSITKTDDRGEYRINFNVIPGVAYRVLAKPRAETLPSVSDIPADPKLRRPARPATYYPSAPSIDQAERLVLRGGEAREGVDIRMLRSPSYCLEGVLDLGGQPGVTSFRIQETEASFGAHPDGGMYGQTPNGKTGPDGRIRICDLASGEYRITAKSPTNTTAEFFFATRDVAITREDVDDFSMGALPRLPLSGEIVWDGAPPEEPVEAEIRISLQSLYRALFSIERDALSVQTPLPGEFSFPGLLMDEYRIRVSDLPVNVYLKDITYGGVSILHDPLRLGSARNDARLRVVVAHDAANIEVSVVDKDNNPVTDANVFVIPQDVATEPELAMKMVSGQVDQHGVYASQALAPGDYLVVAGDAPRDFTPETIGKLWRARPKATEVELEPGAAEEVALEPIAMP